MKKKCEICGEMKPQEDFSKSYKHRCKECVAEQTRNNRQLAKAKPEKSVMSPVSDVAACKRGELLMVSTAMQGLLSNPITESILVESTIDTIARDAVRIEKALLKEIDKKGGEQ